MKNEKPTHDERARAFIDVNCDMGEGTGTDELIMPMISSANIACGYHAGDANTIAATVELAVKNKVAIGAHVSFLDKENFGRREMQLSTEEIYELVTQQLIIMREFADMFQVRMHHIKPHGALYNMSARDRVIARPIAKAVFDFDPSLILYGLSGSVSISEARNAGLQIANEAFADRTYQKDGSLTPRSQANALLYHSEDISRQVIQIIDGKLMTSSGDIVSINAQTICLHGDGDHAVDVAKTINETLKKIQLDIKAV